MAHINSNSNKANANDINVANGELKATTFHDFLGNKAPDTSDLATERNAGDQLEGIPFYGSRDDITGTKSSNKLIGNKRSTSDSSMGSSRDKILQAQTDSQDSRLLSKLLRYSGVEQSRRRTPSHFSIEVGNNANTSEWGGAIPPTNIGPTLKYPALSGQLSSFGYQASSNRFKDTNAGPSILSQKTTDEGSRTGIKGNEILGSMNRISVRQQPSGVLPSAKISQPGSESTCGQMTIFYGGQAHVFDNVHRSKADVIMALAGSNGGSWSTSCNPDSASTGERLIPTGENNAMLTELRWKPLDI